MPNWFTDTMGVYLGTAVFLVLMIICIVLPLLLCGRVFDLCRASVGGDADPPRPERCRPFGLLQPIADGVLKLMFRRRSSVGRQPRDLVVAPMITFV